MPNFNFNHQILTLLHKVPTLFLKWKLEKKRILFPNSVPSDMYTCFFLFVSVLFLCFSRKYTPAKTVLVLRMVKNTAVQVRRYLEVLCVCVWEEPAASGPVCSAVQ